jgi:hypothetical protein
MDLLVQSEEMLKREAEYFHGRFFREALPSEVVERYVAANRICIPVVESGTAASMEKLVSHHLDVEAVEYAFRLKNRDNALTRKIQILFYLVEVRCKYFDYFFNSKKQRLRAAGSILPAVAMAPYKLLKGKYLIRRYGLV